MFSPGESFFPNHPLIRKLLSDCPFPFFGILVYLLLFTVVIFSWLKLIVEWITLPALIDERASVPEAILITHVGILFNQPEGGMEFWRVFAVLLTDEFHGFRAGFPRFFRPTGRIANMEQDHRWRIEKPRRRLALLELFGFDVNPIQPLVVGIVGEIHGLCPIGPLRAD